MMGEWERRGSGTPRAKRGSTRRVQLKFSLPIQDDDDDTHWMFVRPHSQTISLGGCFVESEMEASESNVEEEVMDESPDAARRGPVDASTCTHDSFVSIDEPPAIRNDFHSIPIVDLSLPLDGSNGYASQIAEACRTSGFFYIINHGVDQSLMRAVMEKSRDFFALSGEEKAACGRKEEDKEGNVTSSNGYRGYFGIGMEDLENKDGTRDLVKEEGGDVEAYNGVQRIKGDQKEGFDFGLECIPGYHESQSLGKRTLTSLGKIIGQMNPSVGQLLAFALLKLSDVLMIALAVSLSSNANGSRNQDGERSNGAVPADYFISRSRNPMCTLRLLHYPPAPKSLFTQSSKLLKSPSGCGAHTDYGLFTILQQDDIGGLQVRNKSNEWIDARPLPGSFVINVGDMLSWWTEGEYASTVHRVISPTLFDGANEDDEFEDKRGDGVEVGRHRYSIPFFFNPDHDAVVRPIKDADTVTVGRGNWKTAIEILKDRYAGTFQSK
eukprot:CCRYP_011911-RA/>CCRYP_011911-RA protein AED:0.12 eAED:0.31 QI:0/0/0/1/1/1/2/0/494